MSAPESDGDRATQQPEQDAPQGAPEGQNAVTAVSPERPKRPQVHESDLFPPAAGGRYFGSGSYEMGGTHEGSDASADLNPLGGYGTFSDAGGPGSTTLYGEEEPSEASGSPTEADPAESTPPPGKSPSHDS